MTDDQDDDSELMRRVYLLYCSLPKAVTQCSCNTRYLYFSNIMESHGAAQGRLAALLRHLKLSQHDDSEVQAAGDASDGVSMAPCSSAVHRTLPRFDSNVLADYLDDLRSMKNEVYEVRQSYESLVSAPAHLYFFQHLAH